MLKVSKNIRVTELDGLSDTLVRLFKADGTAASDAFLNAAMAELESLSAKITTAILRSRTISTLDEADDARNEALKSLHAMISGYAAFPIAAKKDAALPLKAVYDKYSKANITRANYTSKSSMIESLLEDLSAPELSESVDALEGVSEAVAKIRSAQDEFVKASDSYLAAKAEKSESASTIRKPIMSLLNEKILPYLDAMVIARNENCASFVRNVEEEIRRINSIVSARSARKQDDDD